MHRSQVSHASKDWSSFLYFFTKDLFSNWWFISQRYRSDKYCINNSHSCTCTNSEKDEEHLNGDFAVKKSFVVQIWTFFLLLLARVLLFWEGFTTPQSITLPYLKARTLGDPAEVIKSTTVASAILTGSNTSKRVDMQQLNLQPWATRTTYLLFRLEKWTR